MTFQQKSVGLDDVSSAIGDMDGSLVGQFRLSNIGSKMGQQERPALAAVA